MGTSKKARVEIENEIIKNSLKEKPLGILIDNRLNFEFYVENLCKIARIKTLCSS